MPSLLVIVAAVIAGFAIGKNFEAAHEAHERFTSYRHRTRKSLDTWVKDTVTTTRQVSGIVLVLVIVFRLYFS